MRNPFHKRIRSWKFCKELLSEHYYEDEYPVTNYYDFNRNWILVYMYNDDLAFIKKYFKEWYKDFIKSDYGARLEKQGEDVLNRNIYEYFKREYQCIELQSGYVFYLLVNRDWFGY